jgi:hypothetical protein
MSANARRRKSCIESKVFAIQVAPFFTPQGKRSSANCRAGAAVTAICRIGWVDCGSRHTGFPSGRLTSSNEGTWVLSPPRLWPSPQTAPPACGSKNFVSVRPYSAPQSHRKIVAIPDICGWNRPFSSPDVCHLFARHSPLPFRHSGMRCQSASADLRCRPGIHTPRARARAPKDALPAFRRACRAIAAEQRRRIMRPLISPAGHV